MLRILFFCALNVCVMGVGVLHAGSSKKDPVIKQPVDQTDIFAIPLDEDEESQDEELQSLEQPRHR